MDVETGSIIWRENYYLKIKMVKCKLFVNWIKKSFTKRHWVFKPWRFHKFFINIAKVLHIKRKICYTFYTFQNEAIQSDYDKLPRRVWQCLSG